jgi:hypothetical protein
MRASEEIVNGLIWTQQVVGHYVSMRTHPRLGRVPFL